MKKALFIATYGGFFSSCEMNNMQLLRKMGYEIHGAANFELIEHNERPKLLEEFGLIQHHIPFIRSLFSLGHVKMYKELLELMHNENYDMIDTHNPIVSVLARIAAKKCKISPVIYTVHGFFFYKGCPKIYKIIFKPIEHFLAHFTDALITINQEDFRASQKMKIRGKSYYIPGVGFPYDKISNQKSILDLRKEIGVSDDTIIIVSVGELNKNKNHEIVIQAISELVYAEPNIKLCYCICGRGELNGYLNDKIQQLGLDVVVKLLGFRLDISQINANADIFVLPSYREGLPVSIMEAMACKLPVLASENRGTRDLVVEGKGGYLFSPNDINTIKYLLLKLCKNKELRTELGNYNFIRAKNYNRETVMEEMNKLYSEVCNGEK